MRKWIMALGVLGALIAAPKLYAAARYLGVTPQGKPAAAANTVHTVCGSCHGGNGTSQASMFPNLAGQNYNYLLKQLEDFRSGARKASPMSSMIKIVPAAKGDQNLENLASYFAARKLSRNGSRPSGAASTTKGVLLEGSEIYRSGLRAERVPACAACHGSSGLGMAPMAIPALAGQHATYVLQELERFADGKRHNSPHHVMATIAHRLKHTQMEAVADYVAMLEPSLMLGTGPKTYRSYVRTRTKLLAPGVPMAALKTATAAR